MKQLLFVLFLLAASPFAAGTPLKYQFDFTVSKFGPSPLDGAALRLDLTWDAAEFPPLFSTSTSARWTAGNASGSLTVTGSAGEDGVYDVSFPDFPARDWWGVLDGGIGADAQYVPAMHLVMNGRNVTMTGPTVYFRDRSFFTAALPNYTIIPKPFSAAESDWNIELFNVQGMGSFVTDVISGSAKQVPEPATLATASVALISLAALRRQQR